MKPHRAFADLIRHRRKELGLTLSDVAVAAQWSIPYISELERGVKQPPPVENLNRLAQVLDLPLIKLVREAELSRRTVEIDLEGASSRQRLAALLLARRFEQGLTDKEADQLIDQFGGEDESSNG